MLGAYEDPELWYKLWEIEVSVFGGFESTFWNYQQLIKGEVGITNTGILVNSHSKNKFGKSMPLPVYHPQLKSQRAPVTQQELFNGKFVIFFKGPENTINGIEEKFKKPPLILRLGRSEDVIYIRRVFRTSDIVSRKKRSREYSSKIPTYLYLESGNIRCIHHPVYYLPYKVAFKNEDENVFNKARISRKTRQIVEYKPAVYLPAGTTIVLPEKKKQLIIDLNLSFGNERFVLAEYSWI